MYHPGSRNNSHCGYVATGVRAPTSFLFLVFKNNNPSHLFTFASGSIWQFASPFHSACAMCVDFFVMYDSNAGSLAYL